MDQTADISSVSIFGDTDAAEPEHDIDEYDKIQQAIGSALYADLSLIDSVSSQNSSQKVDFESYFRFWL